MSEHQLITPRRNFLIRALGFTVAGASVAIPVLVVDDPQKRVNYHLREVTKALQEMYPEQTLLSAVYNYDSWKGLIQAGDIIATVRAQGDAYAAGR
jgi:hypothetical protein